MARSRNIKPAFFLNDDLAEKNCALGRLLFIGLWTLADYRGNLEWRSGKVKAQVLPYDNCDINKIAINLDKSGFIRFYSDGERIFANIVNFVKHQNPHKNEKQAGSDIPEFSESMRQAIDLKELTINRDLSRLKPEQDGTNPADSLLLIPDSLNLIPESLTVDSVESPTAKDDFVSEQFERFWRNYPLKKSKVATARAFKSLVKGKKESQVRFYVDMILNYHIDCVEREKAGSVEDKGSSALHASTLINQQRWKDDPEYFAKFKADWIKENGQD